MKDGPIGRLHVPTDDNAHGPNPRPDGPNAPAGPDEAATPPPARHEGDPPIQPVPRGLSAADFATADGPRQLAVGFGIVAAIILLVIGRRARRRRG
jgi:hypothetical protein